MDAQAASTKAVTTASTPALPLQASNGSLGGWIELG
jgi:hypothetical protein